MSALSPDSELAELLKSPVSVFRFATGKIVSLAVKSFTLSDIDGVPVASLRSLDGEYSLVRFDFDPPRFASLDTMNGLRLSKDEFVRLVKATRAGL